MDEEALAAVVEAVTVVVAAVVAEEEEEQEVEMKLLRKNLTCFLREGAKDREEAALPLLLRSSILKQHLIWLISVRLVLVPLLLVVQEEEEEEEEEEGRVFCQVWMGLMWIKPHLLQS